MYRKWRPLIYGDLDLSDRFLISNDGQLYSLKTNKILKQHLNKQGYYVYAASLGKRGKNKIIKIHRAVAFMFVDGYKKGLIVNHKDGDKTNNCSTNLEWVTLKENSVHAVEHDLITNRKSIICNQTKQIFKSIDDAKRWCGLSAEASSLNEYLLHPERRQSAGKHPITGEKLTWSFV